MEGGSAGGGRVEEGKWRVQSVRKRKSEGVAGKVLSVLRVGSDFSGSVKARTRVRCWQAD